MLDISKIEAGRMELALIDFDLTALIDALNVMFQLRCEDKGLSWGVEWTDTQGEEIEEGKDKEGAERILVHGDEGKLRQVLINLLSNGVKSTESGEVLLRISQSTNRRMEEKEGREEGKVVERTASPLPDEEGKDGRMEGEEESRDRNFTFHVSRFTFHVSRSRSSIPAWAFHLKIARKSLNRFNRALIAYQLTVRGSV